MDKARSIDWKAAQKAQKLETIASIARDINAFVDSPSEKNSRLINPDHVTRFVLCGTSGSGKSFAIESANETRPADEQIAESRGLVTGRDIDLDRAVAVINDVELAYEDTLHVAFDVYYQDVAKALEDRGIKVFWVDRGIADA